MLIKLVLENFKSFKNRTEIDFRKTNYTILPQNVADNGVLKGAVFVGANASGKSNVFASLKLLLDLLFREKIIDFLPYVSLLTDKKMFSLEFHFFINSSNIIYSFSWDESKKFMTEQLLIDSKLLLARQGLAATSYIDGEVHFDATDVPDSQLFLRTLYFNTKFTANETLQTFMNFLMNSIYLDQYDNQYIASKNFALPAYLEKNGSHEVNRFFTENNFKQQVTYINKTRPLSSINPIPIINEELYFTKDGFTHKIPFKYESSGTKSLLEILPLFFHAISNPCMLVIDEFSSSFHNELEELLIKFFMNNAENSQLFVVTHSTNLLSNSILRPDQEFAVEFGEEGSTIKRFSSEQPRAAQNIEKMYESGVFGGLPNYNEVGSHEIQ